MDLEWWQWACGLCGALLMGLGKGGLPGVGNVTVVLFAFAFGPKASVGLLLPVLMSADLVAVIVYRRNANWRYVWKLLPWMVLGIVIGYLIFERISNRGIEALIGFTVLVMTSLQIWRMISARRRPDGVADKVPHSFWFSAGMGTFGGVATMVANAAGPVGNIYFLSVGLPKLAFIGTTAWTFFMVNWIKVPFQVHLGMINLVSIQVSMALMPAAMLGAMVAPRVMRRINQTWFVRLVWGFTIVAGIKMLFF